MTEPAARPTPKGSVTRVRLARVRGAEDLPLPKPATPGSAGVDLAAAVSEALTVPPGGRALVPTGLRIAVPPGYEAQIRPRSGLALRNGIALPNSPGTIDSDYRGEVRVILMNAGDLGVDDEAPRPQHDDDAEQRDDGEDDRHLEECDTSVSGHAEDRQFRHPPGSGPVTMLVTLTRPRI